MQAGTSGHTRYMAWGLHVLSWILMAWSAFPWPAASGPLEAGNAYLAPFMFALIQQGYAKPFLPFWLRLVIAEVQAMCLWLWYTHLLLPAAANAWLAHLVACQVAVVLVPLALHQLWHNAALLKPSKQFSDTSISLAERPLPEPIPAVKPGPSWPDSTRIAPGRSDAASELLTRTMQSSITASSQGSRLQSLTYAPVLGTRQTVCIKIATHHHPESLQPGALDNLARAVERLGNAHRGSNSSGQAVVLSASVRHGCILISLDMRNIASGSAAASGATSHTSAGADDALAYAQQLLPGLLQELGLCSCSGSSCSLPLEPGQYLSLQLGNQLVQATVDPHTGEWVFSVQPVQSSSNGMPQLCLARPCQPAAQPTTVQLPPAKLLGTHEATFAVEVWCGSSSNSSTDQLLVAGSCPGPTSLPGSLHGPASQPGADSSSSSAESYSPSKSSLQLWVHCQGQYLHTRAEVTASNSAGGSTTVTAVVQLPAIALARHHQPSGPAARLQVLTAELWAGDALISSTPLLLDTQQHLQPAVVSTFGWWGAPAAPAAGFVRELAALAADVKASATGPEAEVQISSHQALMSDITAWLSAMQHAAPGTCCDMCVPTVQPSPGLGPEQCQALALSLQRHAASCRLPMTQALVRSQCALVLGPWQDMGQGSAQRTTATASSWLQPDQPTAAVQQQATLSARLRKAAMQVGSYAACGRSCAACDSMYYEHLRAHLQQAHVCVGMCLGLSTLVVVLVGNPMASPRFSLLTGTWALVHLVAALAAWAQYAAQPPAAPNRLVLLATQQGSMGRWWQWASQNGRLQLAAWFLHMCIEVSFYTNIIQIPEAACGFMTLGPYIFSHAIFVVLSEQVHLWGRLPDWVVRSMILFEALLHRHALSSFPLFPRWFVRLWFMAGAMVLPCLLDLHWRRLLRSSKGRSKAGRQVAPGPQGSRGSAGHRQDVGSVTAHAHKE